MAFEKRGPEQVPTASTPPRLHRVAGWWIAWPLAILTAAVASYLSVVVMALIPAFNRSGTPLGTIAVLAAMAALNVAMVAGVIMILVNLTLGLVRYRRRWLYAVAVGGLAYAFCLWVGSVGGARPNPLLYVGMILVPAGIGGWVLGNFRRR
jgi:hypothetical protein